MRYLRDSKIIDLWLASHPNAGTRSCYQRDSARLLAHVRKPLGRITLGDLQSFAESLIEAGLAPISRARTLAATKSLFGFCQRLRYLPANPAAELTLPRYENRLAERVLSEDDVYRLLAAEAAPRCRILLNLLYLAGLRVSEACNLRWRNLHIRGDAGQVSVFGKNGRTRAIALPAGMWTELIGLRGAADAEAPVFPSRTGRTLDRGRVRMIVRQAAGRVGVAAAVSPHWLRHAHASHALDHGAPIHLVQATLGHSSVATTSVYLHARPCDSSARFLAPERFLQESGAPALPLPRTEVMNVTTAKSAEQRKKIMTTFTIDAENNISAFATPDEAAAATTTPFDTFSSRQDLADLIAAWPPERIVATWNSLPGVAPVQRFKTSNVAATKIWERIRDLGEAAQPEQEAAKPAPAAKPKAGNKAKGGAQSAKGAPAKGKATKKATPAKNAPKGKKATKSPEAAGPREGSKTAQVVAMLQRAKGATITEIMDKMQWQRHTVRGFMAGAMKKAGFTVESFKPEGGERSYRLPK
jgi:site-specific recombinase XerD